MFASMIKSSLKCTGNNAADVKKDDISRQKKEWRDMG